MEKVETGVDRMMSVLEGKGKIPLTELAAELKMSESILQLWVDFLVEERVLGIEYKFTTPYVFLNKKKDAIVIVDEKVGIELFKKEFFENAKIRKIPQDQILSLWKSHLNEAIEKQKSFFLREAKKHGFSDASTLYVKYKSTLLSA